MKDKDLGIFCFKDRKFYYFVPGPAGTTNNIERIRTTLLARELIDYQAKPGEPGSYEVMTWGKAKINEYDCIPLYPSAHVRKMHEAKVQEEAASDSWY